jgi:hypothetical protein
VLVGTGVLDVDRVAELGAVGDDVLARLPVDGKEHLAQHQDAVLIGGHRRIVVGGLLVQQGLALRAIACGQAAHVEFGQPVGQVSRIPGRRVGGLGPQCVVVGVPVSVQAGEVHVRRGGVALVTEDAGVGEARRDLR